MKRFLLILTFFLVAGCDRYHRPSTSYRPPAPSYRPPVAVVPQPAPSYPVPQPQPVTPPAPIVVQPQQSWISQLSTQTVGGTRVRFEPTPRAEDVAARVFWTTSDILTPGAYFAGLDADGKVVTVDRRHRGVDSGFIDEYRTVLSKVVKWTVVT